MENAKMSFEAWETVWAILSDGVKFYRIMDHKNDRKKFFDTVKGYVISTARENKFKLSQNDINEAVGEIYYRLILKRED